MIFINYITNILYFILVLLTIYNNQNYDIFYLSWFFLIFIYFLFFERKPIIYINFITFLLIILYGTNINIYQLTYIVLLMLLMILFNDRNIKINLKDIIISGIILIITICIVNIFFFSYFVLLFSLFIILCFILNNFLFRNKFSQKINIILSLILFLWVNFQNLFFFKDIDFLRKTNNELWFYWYLFFLILNSPIIIFCLYNLYKKIGEDKTNLSN